MPYVSLYSYLFSADNPHVPALDTAGREWVADELPGREGADERADERRPHAGRPRDRRHDGGDHAVAGGVQRPEGQQDREGRADARPPRRNDHPSGEA